ncbi:MAG TPA: fibronectin type III domain-containing protein [Nitrospiria bacterium]
MKKNKYNFGILTKSLLTLFLIGNTPGVFAGEALLSWNPNTESDLAGYKVYYGVASNTYGSPIDVGNQTSYTITGLGNGTYYFAITAYDTSLNESGFSLEVSHLISDNAPPVISSIAVPSISNSNAVITWTTNESATSQVDYGTTTSYGSSSALNLNPVTNHSRTLNNLDPSTTYHYRVVSEDASGNIAISADNTFTTSATPDTTAPVLSNIFSSNIGSNSAVITWNSDENATSQVEFGSTTSYGSTSALNSNLTTNHSRTLNGLSSSVTYHYRVKSIDAAGNTALSGDQIFSTTTAPDTTAPVISNISSSGLTTSSLIITWTTDEAATSQVEYGTSSNYGLSTSIISTLLTNHSHILTGLQPNTTYHFRVKNADASGNISISGNNMSSTSTENTPPSGIFNFSGVGGNQQITLKWTNPSDSDFGGVQIYYRTDRFPENLNSVTEEWGNTSTSNHPNTIEDTYIDLNSTNFSLDSQLKTYTWPQDQNANSILLKWDLSTIPSNVTIENATLSLYLEGSGGDSSYDISTHRIINKNTAINQVNGLTFDGTNGWTANNCCNNGIPLAQADILSAEDTQSISTTPGYKTWTVTQMVQEWVNNPSGNFGMLVNSDPVASANSNRIFSSSETSQQNQRPKLIITFSQAPSGNGSPGIVTDGILLGDFAGQPNAAISTIHAGLLNGLTYYYSAYSYDTQGNLQTTPVKVQLKPETGLTNNSGSTAGGCGFTSSTPPSKGGPVDMAMFIIPGLLGLRSLMKRRQLRLKIGYQFLT